MGVSRSRYLPAIGAVGLLFGCHRATEVPPVGSGYKQWVQQDFENLWGWTDKANAASLTREKAHSGHFSLMTGPNIGYSLTFSVPLDRLSQTKPRKLRVQAWAWVPAAKNSTTLVLTVAGAKGAVSWEGLRLASKVKAYGSWQQLDEYVMMSPNITSEDTFTLYMWRQNDNDAAVYLDDLVISEAE